MPAARRSFRKFASKTSIGVVIFSNCVPRPAGALAGNRLTRDNAIVALAWLALWMVAAVPVAEAGPEQATAESASSAGAPNDTAQPVDTPLLPALHPTLSFQYENGGQPSNGSR